MVILPSGNLYGRGASDNKAPVLAWIHAVEAYQALNMVRGASQATGLTLHDHKKNKIEERHLWEQMVQSYFDLKQRRIRAFIGKSMLF